MSKKTAKSEQLQLNLASENYSFPDAISKFIDHIESLNVVFPLVMETILSNHKTAIDKLYKLTNSIRTNLHNNIDPNKKIDIPPEQINQYVKLQKENKNFEIAASSLKKSFIVSLISEFDIHISKLIRIMFHINPEMLNSSEKKLKFSELIGFENIAAAREFIIEEEIETVLRDSHSKQFDWLENKLKLSTLKNFPAWSTFIEITERRNLFVHCDGIISSQYINVCKNNNVIIDEKNKLGHKLDVDEKYFEDAYKCIFETGVKLAQTIWRKLKPEDSEKANINLHNICINLITNEEYGLAYTILDFADTHHIKKSFSEKYKLLFLINKAQTLKWSGKDEEAIKILKNIDWSACANEFKMAKAILLDNFDEAATLLLQVGKNTDIFSKEHYKISPLFREFKKSTLFLETYKKIFGEEFLIEEASSIMEETSSIIMGGSSVISVLNT